MSRHSNKHNKQKRNTAVLRENQECVIRYVGGKEPSLLII